jgi:hypothetical protein
LYHIVGTGAGQQGRPAFEQTGQCSDFPKVAFLQQVPCQPYPCGLPLARKYRELCLKPCMQAFGQQIDVGLLVQKGDVQIAQPPGRGHQSGKTGLEVCRLVRVIDAAKNT